MAKGREIRCYDYVNHRYEQVRDALSKDAPSLFHSATRAATSRARSVASQLRVDLGGIAVEADINIDVTRVEEKAAGGASGPVTRRFTRRSCRQMLAPVVLSSASTAFFSSVT